MIMQEVVVPIATDTVSAIDIAAALTDFISIGVFHTSMLRMVATEEEVFDDLRNLRQDIDQVVQVGNGWGVILDTQTVAVRTMLRIAAVTDSRIIPFSDVAQAIVKMAEWGPDVMDAVTRKEFGKRWGATLEIYPSDNVVRTLAAFVGATVTDKGVDFSTTKYVIEPTELEFAVLEALELEYDRCAPTSRLCRMLPGRPSRTQADYSILKGIPFVLKPLRDGNRLIGYEPNPLLASPEDKSSYVSMYKSVSGERIVLQYVVSEQNVEGNSFNIPSSAREAIDGVYANKRAKGSIKYNIHGRDARKVTGIGKYIRTVYPDYVEGQWCFILLDRHEGSADVILCNQDDASKELEIRTWVDDADAKAA
jgi:hypothetical protein